MSSLFSRSKKKSDADGLLSEQRVERSGSVAIPAEPRPSMVAVGNLVAGTSIQQMQIETRSDSRVGDRERERERAANSTTNNNPPVNSGGSHHRSATHTAMNLGLQAQTNSGNSNSNTNNNAAAAQSALKDVPSSNSSNNSAYYSNSSSNERVGEDSLSTLESAMSMPVVPPNSTIAAAAAALSSTGGLGMPSTIITTTVDDELSAQLVNQLGTALPPRGTRHGQLPSLAVPAQQLQHALQQSSSSSGGMQPPAVVTVGAENDSLSDTMERMKLSANGQPINSDGRKTSITAAAGSSGAQNKKVKSISYAAERVIGNGSFGVVYQASVIETGETVAIKKVLQDKRFKNRELQIMGMLDHPNIVSLKHCFDGQTPVALSSGISMTFQQLAQLQKEIDEERTNQMRHCGTTKMSEVALLAYAEESNGVVSGSMVSAWQQPMRKSCIQLTFEDGRKLICTSDHQFLSAAGQWIAAKDIPLVQLLNSSASTPSHRVQCTPQSPLFEFRTDDKEMSWQLDSFHCRNYSAALRSMSFMRLYGYLCSAINADERCINFENGFDAHSFSKDIELVVNSSCGVESTGNSWLVKIPDEILCLLDDLKTANYLAVHMQQLPTVLVRAFLQGMFSRCGHIRHQQLLVSCSPAIPVQQLLQLVCADACFSNGILSFTHAFSLDNFLQLIGLPYCAEKWVHASLLLMYHRSKQHSNVNFQQFLQRVGAAPSFSAFTQKSSSPVCVLPTFHLGVVDRCTLPGQRIVYDASVVSHHSFLVNGFVAHNCFYSRGDKNDEIYLNLVMEYIPETIHRTIRNHTKAGKLLPITYVKCYLYQMCRSLVYIHHGSGICHRDIKPQNLLLNTKTHEAKLCDFGSAKILVASEPNVSYICSRYYRAPELVFEATDYSTAIDTWSLGCVFAEMLLGNPLFPGESGVDQLIEIIKILGTPSREEIYAMNPNHTSFKFPQIKPHPWNKVFRGKAPPQAVDLVSKLLVYDPRKRLDSLEALTHPFFDELRDPNAKLPNGKAFPNLFNFTDIELREMQRRGLTKKIVPPDILKKLKLPNVAYDPLPFVPPPWDKLPQRVQTPATATATPAGSISQNSQSTSPGVAASVSAASPSMSASK